MPRKTVVLLYGMLERHDNPFGVHCLQVYCGHDTILASEVAFEIVTFSLDEQPRDVARRILDLKPWVLGVSCYVWNADKTFEICNHLKAAVASTLIVAGGPEAGHVPDEVLEECPAVDIVVTGEGEETFRQILLAHLVGMQRETIRGISYRQDARVVRTPAQPSINLGTLPALFAPPQEGYLSGLGQKIMYETLRGCPHVCFFCDWGVLTPGRTRSFSIERIERELAHVLRDHRFSHLYLADSEINVDNDHCKQLLRALKRIKREYGWNGNVTFHLEISKEIDSEMADLLCETTQGIGIGVQSLAEPALYQMGRKWFDVERFQENVERLERDIHFVFQFIYGCPGDTYRSFFDSLSWAVRRDRDVWFDHLQVLPGTIFRNKHERFGIEFENKRPFYLKRSNSFSDLDIVRAENLKRGFLLYNFRKYIHFDDLAEFVGLKPMQLLEAFGRWCHSTHPDRSLAFARTDPRSLPESFLAELADWIGAFIQSRRTVTRAELHQLQQKFAAPDPTGARPTLLPGHLRSPRGN